MSEDIGRNPTPEELERILRPGLPPTGPVERFATWIKETPTEGGTMHYVRSVDSFVASASDLLGYVAPDAPALFGVSARNIVDLYAPSVRAVTRRNNIRWTRAVRRLRPICEIEHRAATSRYWAQRLRWLRRRGRA